MAKERARPTWRFARREQRVIGLFASLRGFSIRFTTAGLGVLPTGGLHASFVNVPCYAPTACGKWCVHAESARAAPLRRGQELTEQCGIFAYVNYLVEKVRGRAADPRTAGTSLMSW